MAKALAGDSMAHVQGGYAAAHHRKPVASAGLITNLLLIHTYPSFALGTGPSQCESLQAVLQAGLFYECQLLPLLFDGEISFNIGKGDSIPTLAC